jgi:predicted nucleotidyltransferase
MCPRCKSKLWKIPKLRPIQPGNGLGIEEILGPHRGEIFRLARKYGARNLRVFGSVARRDASATSDVDLLIDWRKDVSLLDVAGFRFDLKRVLGRDVDTVEEDGLHWALKPQIQAEAKPL